VMPPALTGHGQRDGLARLVVPVLVIHRLHVVTSRVGGHRGEDGEGVLQRDGSAGMSGRREAGMRTRRGHQCGERGPLIPHPAPTLASGHLHGMGTVPSLPPACPQVTGQELSSATSPTQAPGPCRHRAPHPPHRAEHIGQSRLIGLFFFYGKI